MPDQIIPNLSEHFLSHLSQKYPGLIPPNHSASQELISPNLISPFVVEIPNMVLEQAREIISTLFTLAHQKNYRDYYQPQTTALGLQNPGNHGIMMSYDFHIDGSGNLKLIEVNTNAAFLILGYELYQMRALAPSCPDFTLDTLRECIINEINLSQAGRRLPKGTPIKTAIIDDKPEQQRLYIEFLVARELFKKFGFESEILHSADVKVGDFGFVYNRDTDFYLSSERTRNIKALYDSGKICLSPNPFEYFLLADKQRMIEWGQSEWQKTLELSQKQLEIIHRHIPLCLDLAKISREEVWNLRKRLFFKPKRAFGSKQTYKGSSISRKVFDNFSPDEFMAQEYVPAAEINFATPVGHQEFKYDLRCYAYKDELQLVMARLYQGQVTNSKTPYGGFACVQFS